MIIHIPSFFFFQKVCNELLKKKKKSLNKITVVFHISHTTTSTLASRFPDTMFRKFRGTPDLIKSAI